MLQRVQTGISQRHKIKHLGENMEDMKHVSLYIWLDHLQPQQPKQI